MIDKNLIPYIVHCLKQGHNIDSTCRFLMDSGHPMANVYETIKYMKKHKLMPKKRHIKIKFSHTWVYIVTPILMIAAFVYFVVSTPSQSITDEELSTGIIVKTEKNQNVYFDIEGEKTTMRITDVNVNSAEFTISKEKDSLLVGQIKKYDTNDDDNFDVMLELTEIYKDSPRILVKSINEGFCEENWVCGGWMECTAQGDQDRLCVDKNKCRTQESKPIEQQSCTYVDSCIENWQCGEWSPCESGSQSRSCTDTSNCRTIKTKPATTQSCTAIKCIGDWLCGPWSACTARGTQTRECTDNNKCRNTENTPEMSRDCAS